MKKTELQILEKAFEAEVHGALSAHKIHLLQTKSKLAKKLVAEGYLREAQTKYLGLTFSGYELTHLGRITYCTTCE